MTLNRRRFLQMSTGSAALGILPRGLAEPTERLPIIDVHLHAYPDNEPIPTITNSATGKKVQLKDGAAHRAACLAEMKRLNIVKAMVSGGDGDRLAAAISWYRADSARIVPGAGIRGSEDTPLPPIEVLREDFTKGPFRVLGEVTNQYAGLTLDDPGMSFDPCCRNARARFGNPALLEDTLNRYPKLRFNLMHAGWPYLEETIAILFHYPEVNADLGATDWLLPKAEFHSYLHALMQAGFGKRLMFGTDQMYWPEGIAMAVDSVESAPFLSFEEKRDIFYENAVRFYRLNV